MKRVIGILLCGSVLAGTAGVAHAQSGGAAASASPNRAESPVAGQIDDLVVTARKVSERSQDVPIAITAVSADQMRDMQISNYSDLSKSTPSLFVTRYNANPAAPLIAIRGVAQQDVILSIDPPIGVYVDGVYLAHSFGLDAAMIDIERVEVLKGSQGTLFGKNTTGGAISVTSKNPYMNDFGGFIDASVGNYNQISVSGGINIPLVTDQLALRLVGAMSGRKGYGHDGVGRELNDDKSRFFRGKLLWQPTDMVTVVISGDYQKITNNGSASHLVEVNPLPSTTPGTPAVAPAFAAVAAESGLSPTVLANLQTARDTLVSYMYGQPNGPSGFYDSVGTTAQGGFFEGGGGSVDVTADLSDDLTARSITSYRLFKRHDTIDIDGTPFSLLSASSIGKSKNFAQEFQLLGTADKLSWIIGAYANFEHADDISDSYAVTAVNPNNPNRGRADLYQDSKALFAQGTYELMEGLNFTGGFRYTWETKENVSGNNIGPAFTCNVPVQFRSDPAVCSGKFRNKFSDYSYLASIDYKPNPDVLLYAKTSRGFKGGGQNIRGSSVESFAPFAPETVTDYEIGIKADFLDRRLRVNAAAYHSLYDNVQRSARVLAANGSLSPVSLVVNAAKARINGLEVEVTAKPMPELTLAATGGYTDGKYKKFIDAQLGNRTNEPFQVPKYTYALSASYEVPTSAGSVRLSADWNWRSRTALSPSAIFLSGASQPSYGLLNGRVSYSIDDEKLEIAAFIKNAAGKHYYAASTSLDNSLGYDILFPGSPRTFGLQLIKRFGAE